MKKRITRKRTVKRVATVNKADNKRNIVFVLAAFAILLLAASASAKPCRVKNWSVKCNRGRVVTASNKCNRGRVALVRSKKLRRKARRRAVCRRASNLGMWL